MRTYLEIGTSDFDTLNEKFADRPNWHGVSIEAVPAYFQKLRVLEKNVYINAICAEENLGPKVFYYISPENINKFNLPIWLRGCGSIDLEGQPSLKAYSTYVSTQRLETIAVKAVMDLPIFTDTLTGKKRLDLLKIDTEGYDFRLLNALLNLVTPTNIIFETTFMSSQEFANVDSRLRKMGYACRCNDGYQIQYSFPSTLLIVDQDWSTGSIAKDLRCVSKLRHIDYIDWKKYIEPTELDKMIAEYDSVVSFCLSSPAGWRSLAQHGVVCCGKIEVDWVRNTELLGGCFGTVSYETYSEFLKLPNLKPVYYTPASARLSRFVPPKFARPIKTLGWCGVPVSAHHFGQDAKRFCMFEEIVAKTGLQAKVSHQNYTYATMQEFYDSIDLLICTSSTEGGPLGVFEAIASGVPVISTDVGLVKEFKSIQKFETAGQAVEFIQKLSSEYQLDSYRNKQYYEMATEKGTEHLIGYWEEFFRACERLNTNRTIFF